MKLPTPIKTDNPVPWCLPHLLRWPTLCLWSVFLSKQIHFLPITLSLAEFFLQWDVKNLSFTKSWNQVWISVGRLWVLAGFESWPRGFESQSEFWLGLSPSCMGSSPSLGFGRVQVPATWVQVPIWGARFQSLISKDQSKNPTVSF